MAKRFTSDPDTQAAQERRWEHRAELEERQKKQQQRAALDWSWACKRAYEAATTEQDRDRALFRWIRAMLGDGSQKTKREENQS
jgi:hypothetical protein